MPFGVDLSNAHPASGLLCSRATRLGREIAWRQAARWASEQPYRVTPVRLQKVSPREELPKHSVYRAPRSGWGGMTRVIPANLLVARGPAPLRPGAAPGPKQRVGSPVSGPLERMAAPRARGSAFNAFTGPAVGSALLHCSVGDMLSHQSRGRPANAGRLEGGLEQHPPALQLGEPSSRKEMGAAGTACRTGTGSETRLRSGSGSGGRARARGALRSPGRNPPARCLGRGSLTRAVEPVGAGRRALNSLKALRRHYR